MRPSIEIQEQYKKKIANIAKTFDAFCTKHDLQYFAIGGTAIGALRHKGFIPWDDDIDFIMPRPDYEKFLQLADELKPDYEMLTHHNTPNYPLTMGKLCDANTTYIATFAQHFVSGAFVDIFPIDGCPGTTKEERIKFFNDYMKIRHDGEFLRSWYSAKYLLSLIHIKKWEDIPRLFRSWWYHLIGRKDNPFFGKCDRILAQNPYESAEYVSYFGTWKSAKNIFPKEWLDGYYYAPFEDFQIRLPKGIHEYLTQLFGDYMTPPPPDFIATDDHGFAFLDLEKRVTWEEAYKIYKKENNE